MKIRRDPLDILFSEFIRKRAILRGHCCERCGHGKASYHELEAAHCHGRGAKSVRFDPDNSLGLCYGCHRYIDSQHVEKERLFREKIGDEGYEALKLRYLLKRPKPDRELIAIWLHEKIKEIGYVE